MSEGERAAVERGSMGSFESALEAAVETLRRTMMAEHERALALQRSGAGLPVLRWSAPLSHPAQALIRDGAQQGPSPGCTPTLPSKGDEELPGAPSGSPSTEEQPGEAAAPASSASSGEGQPASSGSSAHTDDASTGSFALAQELPHGAPQLLTRPSRRAVVFDCEDDDFVAKRSSFVGKRSTAVKGGTQKKGHSFNMTDTEKKKKKHKERWHRAYEWCVALLIVMNTLWLSIEIEASAYGQTPGTFVHTVDGLFCFMFALDIVVRVVVNFKRFVGGPRRGWNLFDSTLALIMCLDFFFHFGRLNFLRLLATVRLARLTHLKAFTRRFHAVWASDSCRDLRILLKATKHSMPALVWVMLVSSGLVYFCALGLTDGTFGLCDGDHGDLELCEYFGTLELSFMSLNVAMYDGTRWAELLQSLAPLNPGLKAVFFIKIFFLKVIVVNLILGVVIGLTQRIEQREVEVQRANARDDRARQIANLRALFQALDMNNSGAISLDELELAVEDPEINAAFAQLRLDTDDTYALFAMLDEGNHYAVDIEEFITGMMAITGDARAVDVVKIQRQCTTILRSIEGLGASDLGQAPMKEASSYGQAFTTMSTRCGGWRELFWNGRRAPVISRVEMRAMTLEELRQIRALIGDSCSPERWKDAYTEKVLSPDEVNLYHFASNFISPMTAPRGVIMRIPGCAVDKGATVQQFDDKSRCMGEGEVMEKTESGIRVRLNRGFFTCEGARLLVDGVDFDQPAFIETPESISYKELVSSKPTRPVWFCSHWWGETVYDFVEFCEEHARLRKMDPSSATYWVCGYANRQHALDLEIGGELEDTSFRRAMRASQGTLLLLEENATAFTRIWCDFEIFCTVSDGSKLFDIVTKLDGAPNLLSSEALPKETTRARTLREAKFPVSLLVKGMYLRLEDGEATNPADKEAILNYIKNFGPSGGGEEECLRSINDTLHAVFARSAWPQAIKRNMVENFDPDHPGALKLPDLLRKDTQRQRLHLSLEHMDQVTDSEVKRLASGLSDSLIELKLSFEGCQNVSSASVAAIAAHLPPQIRVLKLDFLGCPKVDNYGLRALAAQLPEGLLSLELHFDRCNNITADGVQALAAKMPRSVKEFTGTFRGTGVDRNFSSVREFLRHHSLLRILQPFAAKLGQRSHESAAIVP